MGEKVYPFNASKKLYQVNGEWVKASCGGKNILNQWDEKRGNECWLIENPQEEKIIEVVKFYIHFTYSPHFQSFTYDGYTNDEFDVLNDRCDGYGIGGRGGPDTMAMVLGRTPEANRLYFADWRNDAALECELEKIDKNWEDIDVIKKGAVRRESTYVSGNHQDHAYVEYLVYFK